MSGQQLFAEQYRQYEVGQRARIWMSGHKGEMSEYEIIHKFDYQGLTLYVLEVPCPPVGEIYEVRSGHVLSMRPALETKSLTDIEYQGPK